MSTADKPRALLAKAYQRYADEYCRSLPLEHFMEAIGQSRQREITLESLALVRARRSDVHVFNELLVQYPREGEERPGQVVPDNMVVISDQPPRARGSFDTPLEPAKPHWVLDYVSPYSERKDYEDSFAKYERELRVPYALFFYPDAQELSLYRHNGRKYVSVKPNKHGRYAVAKLDIEVGLLDGWMRFWYQGELLPLPGDLQHQVDESRRQTQQERQRAEEAAAAAEQQRRRAEEAAAAAEHERRAKETAEREVEQLRARLAELERRRRGWG